MGNVISHYRRGADTSPLTHMPNSQVPNCLVQLLFAHLLFDILVPDIYKHISLSWRTAAFQLTSSSGTVTVHFT